MSEQLKPCPCGKTPVELLITYSGRGGGWAKVEGDCCGYWSTDFRTQYARPETPECMARAVQEWNNAPRGKE